MRHETRMIFLCLLAAVPAIGNALHSPTSTLRVMSAVSALAWGVAAGFYALDWLRERRTQQLVIEHNTFNFDGERANVRDTH